MDEKLIIKGYEYAREVYAERGIDVEAALTTAGSIPISMNCWQGDDVMGFEGGDDAGASGGIATTGNYPGRARTADELRADADLAMSMIPGPKKFNLHASYAEDSKAARSNAASTLLNCSRAGSTGRASAIWAWTVTRPTSRIQWSRMALRCPALTRLCASTG